MSCTGSVLSTLLFYASKPTPAQLGEELRNIRGDVHSGVATDSIRGRAPAVSCSRSAVQFRFEKTRTTTVCRASAATTTVLLLRTMIVLRLLYYLYSCLTIEPPANTFVHYF